MKDQPTADIVFAPLWMLVHTNPQREAQAMTNLTRAGFDVFLPLARNRPGDPDRPLFRGYLFVDVVRPERIGEAASCENVSSVLKGAGGDFYCVPHAIVDDLKAQCAEGIVLTKMREIRIGETIIIPSGSLKGQKG